MDTDSDTGGSPHTIAADERAQILEGHPRDAGDAVAALDSLSSAACSR